MRCNRIHLACLGLGLVLGCASPPPPDVDPGTSVVAAAVHIDIAYLPDQLATEVYFLRLDAPSGPSLSRSNFYEDGYAYLVNAAPGRYALIAGAYQQESSVDLNHLKHPDTVQFEGGYEEVVPRLYDDPNLKFSSTSDKVVYAPAALVERSAASVGADEVLFLGEVVLHARGDWEEADDTQKRFVDRLAPGYRGEDFWGRSFSGGWQVPSQGYELDDGDAARDRFLARSRDRFSEGGWAELLANPVAASPR